MRVRVGNLSIFWKVLAPFVALLLIVGGAGAFLITRNLASQAQSTLNQDLQQASLETRSLLQNRELYLLESANLAANLQGMSVAVSSRNEEAVTRLLRSVVALKTDLDLVGIVSRQGEGITAFATSGPEGQLQPNNAIPWAASSLVKATLAQGGPEKGSGFFEIGEDRFVVIVAPVCSVSAGCTSVGGAIVGMRVDRLTEEVAEGSLSKTRASVAIYGGEGSLLSSVGPIASTKTAAIPEGDNLVRRSENVDGEEIHTLYAPFQMQGRSIGIFSVSLPSEPIFASVRDASRSLTFLMLAALMGIIGLGALISRHILKQVRPLVEVNRALGSGDLSARVPVVSRDEIGEVARGLNQMAEQLQASHENLESRVTQRTEEVQRLLMQRTEFFASLSHELRTPLAVILNESDAILEDKRHNASARAIKTSGAHLLAVVNDILDLARAEVGGLDIEPCEVDLGKSLEELEPTITGLARAGALELTVSIPQDLPSVAADPQRFREILLNLIDNAVKYTPAGGKISLTAEVVGGSVSISIRDSGPGIPKDVGDQIFEPFYRVKGTKVQKGRSSSGLGLALTKRLVEAHGGGIGYREGSGEGTTFTFTLPLFGSSKGHQAELGIRETAINNADLRSSKI